MIKHKRLIRRIWDNEQTRAVKKGYRKTFSRFIS